MDEVARTLDVYESDSGSYAEKYTAESVARLYGDPFFDALDSATDDTPRVLDIGCGPGPDAEAFVGAGLDVTGLDLTQSFLREGNDRVPDAAFVRGDMRALPFASNTFDGLWASASFHHIPQSTARETLREWHRVLRPAGCLFLSVKRDETRDDDTTDRFFEYYDVEAFRALLDSAAFEPTQLQTDGKWVSAIATV